MEKFKLSEIREKIAFTDNEIENLMKKNPQWGERVNGQWVINDVGMKYLTSEEAYLRKAEVDGLSKIDIRNIKIDGDILDIGAGGEGVISLNYPDQVFGIALEEHKEHFAKAPSCRLKILMDARDLKFLDNTFENITAFFTFMYIDFNDYPKVFSEISRVLKTNGKFFFWDMNFPESRSEKEFYIRFFEIETKTKKVDTGYGCDWKNRSHKKEILDEFAEKAGLECIHHEVIDRIQFNIYQKRLG